MQTTTPVSDTESSTAQRIAQSAQHFEAYSRGVSRLVARRAVYWQTVAQAGLPAQSVRDVATNEAATARAARWQAWLTELDAGRAELVPWQRGVEPIRLAVRRAAPSPLGLWPVVLTIVRLGIGAVLSGAAWLAADAWGETQKVEAEARRLDAATRAQLGALAKADPRLAPQILEAMAAASRASATAGPDWIDRLTSAAGAGLGGAALAFGLFWFLSRNRRRRYAR